MYPQCILLEIEYWFQLCSVCYLSDNAAKRYRSLNTVIIHHVVEPHPRSLQDRYEGVALYHLFLGCHRLLNIFDIFRKIFDATVTDACIAGYHSKCLLNASVILCNTFFRWAFSHMLYVRVLTPLLLFWQSCTNESQLVVKCYSAHNHLAVCKEWRGKGRGMRGCMCTCLHCSCGFIVLFCKLYLSLWSIMQHPLVPVDCDSCVR